MLYCKNLKYIVWLHFQVISLIVLITVNTSAQVTVNPTLELNAPGIVDQDEMCIWIHPTDKSLSTIISSDKDANKLFVYDLEGNVLQTIDVIGQKPGNIDVRYNFPLAGEPTDIVGYSRRSGDTEIIVYKVDRDTRQLLLVGSLTSASDYGFCLYKSPVTGKYYGFVSSYSSDISQYEIADNNNDGIIEGTLVRQMNNGSGYTEGMVADDETGILYAANESSGIYKFDAEPDSSADRSLVAQTGFNGLTQDVEGLSIYYRSNGEGYIIASSQGSDNFKVYERQAPHNFVNTVEVTGVGSTDGICVTNVSLGTFFPYGIFAMHDGTGSPFAIRGCRWEDLELAIDTTYWNPRTSPFVYTTNTFAVIGDFGTAGDPDVEDVADMVKGWNPEYVITTGDNSYDSTPIDDNIGQYYSKFIYPYIGSYLPSSPDKNRFWVSVGNHDYSDGGGIVAQKAYFPYFVPNTYYDIVIGDVHFFMLDSEEFSSYSDDQKTWFDNAVANSTANWRIAAFHQPPYTSGRHPPNTDMRGWPFNENDFHLVFNGHNHHMEHLTVPGQLTQYCMQGAGGRSLYSFVRDPSPAISEWKFNNQDGACKVIVTQDNITVEFWSTNGTTETLEYSFSLNNPLPVELSYFEGKVFNDKIKLNWRTETEIDNYGFEVERKRQDVRSETWEKIGFVEGSGNSNSPKDYSFTDDLTLTPDLTYTLRYRLKQLDTDGKFEYSKVIEVELGSPQKFELSQNYPNPFNPETKITYSLTESGNVKLTVYNLLGEQVAVLVNEFKEAGFHTINFNAENLLSGIYIYRINAEQFSDTKKMLLIK
jgi:3-phytase